MSQGYFDESAYLARYPDVATAVKGGDYVSGFEHYFLCGQAEGRLPPIYKTRKEQNERFFDDTVDHIEGWLDKYAALISMYILDIQLQRRVSGSLIEIGIFKGKYFSILLREAKTSGDPVMGIDNFAFVSEATVAAILKEKMPGIEYRLIAKASNSLTGDELLTRLDNKKCRFISIDGSHECDDVVWDLRLAEEVLSPEGVVAVDDFMNVINIGVNEGVHQFFSHRQRLVPFAFVMNKLFLCRPHVHGLYKDAIEAFVESDVDNPHSHLFLLNRARYREAVEQKLWHHKVLTIW